MAQYVSGQQQDVATRVDTAIAAGAGDHLPIGDWQSADYRSALRFAVPAGWTAWTAITSATLKVYISDHQHVGPKNSSIFCSRMNVPVWTKDQGSQDCESGFSGGNTTQAPDIQSVSTNRISFNSGSTPNAAKTLDVTAMVRYYQQNNSPLVFVFDNDGADQYTELWSLGKAGATYDAVLTINYENAAPPLAPTPTTPTAGETGVADKPTFSWTHNDPDAQNNAEVRVYDAAGTTLLYTWNPTLGTDKSLVAPVALVHGTVYQWEARTSDAVSGYGPYSTKRSFTVKANPVPVIDTVRYMEFYNGLPRLRVKWSVTGGTQYKYRVTAGAYDSGLLTSPNQSHLLDTLALTSGTAVPVTVYVETAEATNYTGSAVQSFTPRFGLTTHRRDLGAVPVGWGVPSWLPAAQPAGTDLRVEYGSSATATATPSPNVWYPILSSVPLAQFLFYRVWFIPSATQGPTLDYINIPTDATASFVDKWGTTRDAPGLTGVWSVSGNEYVYGSRSLWAKVSGAGPFYCYAYKVTVKKDRSYILTGLMQSVGNSGACIELQDAAGTPLMTDPVPPAVPKTVRTDVLTGDKAWFTTDGRDVNRYKTDPWKATFSGDVYVVLKVGGTSGAQAWFDAVKLEESTVATPWSPGAVGATVVDAGGVQIDGSKGGIFRYRGTSGGVRDVVEGWASGLRFAGDTELTSPADGSMAVDGVPISLNTHTHSPYVPPAYVEPVVRVYAAGTTWTKPAGLKYIEVEVQAGGGGGGGVAAAAGGTNNIGGGGGGGGYGRKMYPASVLSGAASAYAIAVGAAGTGAAAGNNSGGVGGTSSFTGTNAALSASGGGGGGGMPSTTGNTNSFGGVGGVPSGHDMGKTGDDGGMGRTTGGIMSSASYGGGSMMGGSTRIAGTGTNGAAGSTYGGGGGGAVGTSADVVRPGGIGGAGLVIVTEYY